VSALHWAGALAEAAEATDRPTTPPNINMAATTTNAIAVANQRRTERA
jgi:hypothetical protein